MSRSKMCSRWRGSLLPMLYRCDSSITPTLPRISFRPLIRPLTSALLPAACLTACSGGPDIQSAVDNEPTAATVETLTTTPAGNSELGIPAGYEIVPGGYVHSSCIHHVPNGGKMDADNVLDANGAVVSQTSPCAYPSKVRRPGLSSDKSATENSIVPGLTAWVEDTYQRIPSGAFTWNHYVATLTVPPLPARDVDQTLFYFGGMVSASGNEILQPVLQFGPSSAGGGGSWTFASWLVGIGDRPWTAASNLVGTSPGHTLGLEVALTAAEQVCQRYTTCIPNPTTICGTKYTWLVSMQDVDTALASNLTIVLGPDKTGICGPPAEFYPDMYPAVLEEKNAIDCPSSAAVFPWAYITADQFQLSVLNRVYQVPNFTTHTTSRTPPFCFYGATWNPHQDILNRPFADIRLF